MTRKTWREAVAHDDELVRVSVLVRRGTLEQVDQIALRAGVSRHEVFREALSWQVVREYRTAFRRETLRQRAAFHAWLEQMRRLDRELHSLQARAADVMAMRGQQPLQAGILNPPRERVLPPTVLSEGQDAR